MKEKFYTDNAAPCWGRDCGSTVATYTVDSTVTLVDVLCASCGRRDAFTCREVLSSAAAYSSAHRAAAGGNS